LTRLISVLLECITYNAHEEFVEFKCALNNSSGARDISLMLLTLRNKNHKLDLLHNEPRYLVEKKDLNNSEKIFGPKIITETYSRRIGAAGLLNEAPRKFNIVKRTGLL